MGRADKISQHHCFHVKAGSSLGLLFLKTQQFIKNIFQIQCGKFRMNKLNFRQLEDNRKHLLRLKFRVFEKFFLLTHHKLHVYTSRCSSCFSELFAYISGAQEDKCQQ